MTRNLVIVGCGGFGREVYEVVNALRAVGADWLVDGFVDDDPSEANVALVKRLGSRLLGPIQEICRRGDAHGVIAIGSPSARRSVAQQLRSAPVTWATLIHPDATVGPDVVVGQGTVVAAGARLSTNIGLGRHVHVDQNVTVGHDAQISDFARLNPQACISGAVLVEDGALIGANATVLQGLSIGSGAVVGAGAVVVNDVAPATVVKGVPAR